MRYNGIILAVVALFVRGRAGPPPTITTTIAVLTMASILACLLVVGVFWRFYSFVGTGPINFSREMDLIRRVLVLREAAYQLAWWLAVIVSVILILHFTDFIGQAQRQ